MDGEKEPEASSNDLPLSANLQDIVVKHFVLDLSCHMDQQVFEGSITLWCLPAQTSHLLHQRAEEEEQQQQEHLKSALKGEDSEVSDSSSCARGDSDRGVTGDDDERVKDNNACDSRLTGEGNRSVMGGDSLSDVHISSPQFLQGATVELAVTGRDDGDDDDDRRMTGSGVSVQAPDSGAVCVHSCLTSDAERDNGNIDAVPVLQPSIPQSSLPSHNCATECDHGYAPPQENQTNPENQRGHENHRIHPQGNQEDKKSQQHCFSQKGLSSTCVKHKHECSGENHSQLTDNDTDSHHHHHHHDHHQDHHHHHHHHESQQRTDTDTDSHHHHHYDHPHHHESQQRTDSDTDSQHHHHHHHHHHEHHKSQQRADTSDSDTDSYHHHHHEGQPFKMILDSYSLDVQRVEGLYLRGADKLLFEQRPDQFVQRAINIDGGGVSLTLTGQPRRCYMQFTVKEHCVHVFEDSVRSPRQFPHAVQIWYRTHPSGPSLKWTTDQDGNCCVFTAGHFLGNRSLLPSQDLPTALPTWHASVTVDPAITVLLTGDLDPQVTTTQDGRNKFSYFTNFPMPSSTFAVAVGRWKVETLDYGPLLDDVKYLNEGRPAIRLCFPLALKTGSLSLLGTYLPHCLLEAQRLLGAYPFHRLDVLMVPPCFDSLGMASPSLLFLSQSVLCEDGSMCMRVAHELCHTWFGLVIGPRDWTEEWMTEGFCTYLEDILHARVVQLGEMTENFLGLRSELHLRLLRAEMENTDENLQCLRPNQGQGDASSPGGETRYLKNGMNAEKKFMQVHYLKGYFLLCALEREVGREQFLSFLKAYVQKNLCMLVTSQEFLQLFFSTFPGLIHMSVESINADWLDCPGMPKGLTASQGTSRGSGERENTLYIQVQQQLAAVVKMCHRRPHRKRGHGGRSCHGQQLPEIKQMQSAQVVMLVDGVLEERRVPGHVLDLLRSSCGQHLDNPEVCHRWCELVIKHRHKKWYSDVQRFLTQHQAMGVYLYGEASISRNPDVVRLARSCFQQLQHDMPESVRDTVSAMLYGT